MSADTRARAAERAGDTRAALLEAARAGDPLAAAEFASPEEAVALCGEWLRGQDREPAALHYYSRSEFAASGVGIIYRDHLTDGIKPGQACAFEERVPERPGPWSPWVAWRHREAPFLAAHSLPALCRALRAWLAEQEAAGGGP